MDEFEDTVIYYNDHTLYLGKLSFRLGAGELNRFYLQDIANILEILFIKLKVDSKMSCFMEVLGRIYVFNFSWIC